MTGRCTVCRHDQREAIDRALLGGETVRSVASRFVTATGRPLGRMAVYRHKDEHLPEVLRRGVEAQGLAHALDLVLQLQAMNSAAVQVLERARATGDGELALKAIDRVVRQLELVAKASGDIDERPQINLYALPEFVAVQAALVEALGPYPDAREAVVARLVLLDGERRPN